MVSSSLSSGDLIADRRYAYAMAALKDGDYPAAIDLFEQVLELVPAWAPAWLSLGDARAAIGASEAAIAAWQKVREADPEDVLGAKPRLARLGIGPIVAAVGDAYIRALFDDYAPRFDSHLRGALGYSGPETLMEALDQIAPGRQFDRTLDLGCGTGLMGEAIRTRTAWLGGCDLSAAMVTKASGRGLYDELTVESLLDFLKNRHADLVLAADVLVYIGDLAPVFDAVATSLTAGGVFGFTVQKAEAGVILGEDLRYAHSEQVVNDNAAKAGLTVHHLAACSTRRDGGVPVPGLVVMCGKS